MPQRRRRPSWLLIVSVAEGGPQGRSGTVAVPGEPSNGAFVASGAPFRLDHGPDFYAFQSFSGPPAADVVGMAWMASWDDAWVVPSAGWRGVQSIPRRLRFHDDVLHQWPAELPRSASERGATMASERRDQVVTIEGVDGSGSEPAFSDGSAFIERWGGWTPTYDGHYEAPVVGNGPNLVVVDHGTVEVFAAGGAVTLSALVFAGPSPSVTFS